MKRNRVKHLPVAVAVVALAASIAPGSVSAVQDDGNSTCSASEYCAYTGSNFTGSVWTWFGDDNDWPAVIDEDESSVWNRSTGYVVRVYDFTGFGSYIYCTPKNSFYGTMGISNDGNSHTWNGLC